MKAHTRLNSICLQALLLCSLGNVASLKAQSFPSMGARSLGVGRAFVARADDASAADWNPACLAVAGKSGLTSYNDTGDVGEELSKNIETLHQLVGDRSDIARRAGDALRARTLLESMAATDSSMSGNESIALFAGRGDFAFSTYRTKLSSATPTIDLVHVMATDDPDTSFANNTSTLDSKLVELTSYDLTLSGTLGSPHWSTGVTARYFQSKARTASSDLFAVGSLNARDVDDQLGGAPETKDSAFSFDIGTLFLLHPKAHIAVVGKHINKPKIDLPNGEQYEIDPRWRSGVALYLHENFTLSGDLDLTSPKGLSGFEQGRELAIGAEAKLAQKAVMLRAGFSTDLSRDIDHGMRFSGGLGLQLGRTIADGAITQSTMDGSFGFAVQIGYRLLR